jgi:hypothetical protein
MSGELSIDEIKQMCEQMLGVELGMEDLEIGMKEMDTDGEQRDP